MTVILSQGLNYGRHLVNVYDSDYSGVYDWWERENCFLANTYFTYTSDNTMCYLGKDLFIEILEDAYPVFFLLAPVLYDADNGAKKKNYIEWGSSFT